MSLTDLKRELRLKALVDKVYSSDSTIDVRVYNYLEILEREGQKYTSKIMELISTIDNRGYEELSYQIAVASIKDMKVVEEKATTKKTKDSPSVQELLQKIRKERGN